MSELVKIDFDYTVQLIECSLYEHHSDVPFAILNTQKDLEAKLFFSTIHREKLSADDLVRAAATTAGAKDWAAYIPEHEGKNAFQNGQAEFDVTIPFLLPRGDVQFQRGVPKVVGQAKLKMHFRISPKKQ